MANKGEPSSLRAGRDGSILIPRPDHRPHLTSRPLPVNIISVGLPQPGVPVGMPSVQNPVLRRFVSHDSTQE